jgi:hypothetical protein
MSYVSLINCFHVAFLTLRSTFVWHTSRPSRDALLTCTASFCLVISFFYTYNYLICLKNALLSICQKAAPGLSTTILWPLVLTVSLDFAVQTRLGKSAHRSGCPHIIHTWWNRNEPGFINRMEVIKQLKKLAYTPRQLHRMRWEKLESIRRQHEAVYGTNMSLTSLGPYSDSDSEFIGV